MKATRGDDDGQVNNPKTHIKKPKWNYLPTHFSKEPNYINIDNLDSKTLLIAWAAVLTGMFIHITTEKFKRSKATGLPQIVATSDWLIYFSAHKGDILLKLLMAIVWIVLSSCLVRHWNKKRKRTIRH